MHRAHRVSDGRKRARPLGALPHDAAPHIFRQGTGSDIAVNGHRVNAGERPQFRGAVRDCVFFSAETPSEAAQTVVKLVAQRIPARRRYHPRDIQVLSSMYRGEAGGGALNGAMVAAISLNRARSA